MTKKPTQTKSKLSILQLVYPPVSNQEMIWFKDEPGVEERLRQSDFYMIGAREEAKYENITPDRATETIHFDFVIGERFRDSVHLDVRELPGVKASSDDLFAVETGPKIIRVLPVKDGEPDKENPVEWFTTEKLIWDRARQRPGISGFDRHREAAQYDLLYVGIAKSGDTYDRLIEGAHHARQKILGNELQRGVGTRVTDEVYLFPFRVEPMYLTTYDPDHEFDEADFNENHPQKRVVADAEKAYVSMMQPGYNVQMFKNYPKGADGLYNAGFARYGYAIGESLSFRTSNGEIKGSFNPITRFIDNDADAIFVDGDSVRFFKSGVDFPGESASDNAGDVPA